ncbi:MAG: hypothetical protein VX733_13860 [Candidatus Latescibacterota bacterium]|nr:hypothetical protein [Candidatus Latescibacterota bacterium]
MLKKHASRRHPRRLIWFCHTEAVAERPASLQRLRDEVGLTTIMPESPICHTSGFRASPGLADRGPFEDWRTRQHRYPRIAEGVYPPVAGVVGGFDDAPLQRVLEHAARLGLEVWGHLGLWSYGGEIYPEHAMRDFAGRHLSPRFHKWGNGLCPSRKEVNDWVRDGLVDVVERYSIDGLCVDHARYPAPANVESLAACACDSCCELAAKEGIDLESLRGNLTACVAHLSNLRESMPLAEMLEQEESVQLWLRFRARVLSYWMREFRDAVTATRSDMVFGSDVFPPSTALLGGQDLIAWQDHCDYLTGGSSHGGVVGWATCATNLACEWAPWLSQRSGAAESLCLQRVYALMEIADLALPNKAAELKTPANLPLSEIYERELVRLVDVSAGSVPLYPPISATAEPTLVRQLCEAVRDVKCHGAMITVNPDSDEHLGILADTLADVGG